MRQLFGLLAVVTIACADVSHLGYHYAPPAKDARIKLFPHNQPASAIYKQQQQIAESTMMLEDTHNTADLVPLSPAIAEPTRVFLPPPVESKETFSTGEPAKTLLAPREKFDDNSLALHSGSKMETNPFFKKNSAYPASQDTYSKQSLPIAMKTHSTPENTYIPPSGEAPSPSPKLKITLPEHPKFQKLEKSYIPPLEDEKLLPMLQEIMEKLTESSPANEEMKTFEVPPTVYLPPQTAKQPRIKIMLPTKSYIPPAVKEEAPLKMIEIEVPENTYLPATQKPIIMHIKEVKVSHSQEKYPAEEERIVKIPQTGYLPAYEKHYRPSMPLVREAVAAEVNVKEQNQNFDQNIIAMFAKSSALPEDKTFMHSQMKDSIFVEKPVENIPITIDIPNYVIARETGDFVGPSAFRDSK